MKKSTKAMIWSILLLAVAAVVGALFPTKTKDLLSKVGIKDLDKKIGENKEVA